jgi:hypothetical protein
MNTLVGGGTTKDQNGDWTMTFCWSMLNSTSTYMYASASQLALPQIKI